MGGGGQKSSNDNASDDGSAKSKDSTKKDVVKEQPMASIRETLSFAFEGGVKLKLIFAFGCIGGFANGLVYPAIAWIFASAFSELSANEENGLDPIKRIAYIMVGLGVFALIAATVQTSCFEIVAFHGAQSLRLKWFRALLRQDPAFFDVYDIGGLANSVNPAAAKYRRGIGRKFGEGIQFTTMAIGSILYALYEEWRVTLVVMLCTPIVCVFSLGVIQISQSKSSRATEAYSRAGSVAYTTVSGIKTILSLNAGPKMIQKYGEATEDAFNKATKPLAKQGFVYGMMLGSFMIMYCIFTLFGTYQIYKDIKKTGCDPLGVIPDNEACPNTASSVFGVLMGIAFSAQAGGQMASVLELFSVTRVAAGQAMMAINRKQGQPEEKIYHIEDEKDDSDDNESVTSSSLHSSHMIESPEGRIKAILPQYEIDALADGGLKPEKIDGRLTFDEVGFFYPTRPGQMVLNELSIDIAAGNTIAFVGPSGGGKSTIVKLLERFYDPTAGSVKLDGTDIKEINVKHLRHTIGYVGQEPVLFATSIGKNIAFGYPGCSQKQIEEAAKLANAHDFIMKLPDGYDTDVGDKGSQLSGGQKQRIAIARVLIADPKILLLDEATSALDSQSELVVQEALEKIMSTKKRTTVIIAHRLSTIRNADVIAVVMGGTIVETGTHDNLIKSESYYKKLVDAQGQTAMKKISSVVPEPTAVGQSESEMGVEKVPDQIDMDADPMIVFRNVTFAYPTRPTKKILDKFKLKVYKGETIGLCGISGGGKSTVMGLIERFYDPEKGSVEFFGQNINDLNVKWYRDQIGYVGQEPTLFEATIAENIAYGAPEATKEQIIEAAKQANAYDFIMKFPENFDTPLSGGSGTQLSGGQKQRVAIARALVKKPEILLLDEATSALDNESERIVQEALDKLMESKERTCIVIAHRLSTIRNADRIAFIGDGHVKEIGSHDELIEKSNGKYKRLVETQNRTASTIMDGLDQDKKKKKKKKKEEEEEEEEVEVEENFEAQIEKVELSAFNLARARQLAASDSYYLAVGAVGAVLAGCVFPSWGYLFAVMIDLVYRPVLGCVQGVGVPCIFVLDLTECPSDGLVPCDEYWNSEADYMRKRSYALTGLWVAIIVVNAVGNILLYWGFGHASERMSRRVRDAAFQSLVRQDVSFFDKRKVGKITSELQEDATRIQIFTGDPIKQFLMSLSGVATGVIISFVFMWPFAILALACIPVMGFASSLEMKQMMGEDMKEEGNVKEEVSSPGGIVVETLLNMGTVSALTLEEERYRIFQDALDNNEDNYVKNGLHQGVLSGLSVALQQWIFGLQFWFGGWILTNYPENFTFFDMNVSMFCILFGVFTLGAAFQDMADRKETEESASRIFYLIDRKSDIDPLSEEGKTLDYNALPKPRSKKKSIKKEQKKKKRASSMKNVAKEDSDYLDVDDADFEKKKSSSMTKKKSKRMSKKNLDADNKPESTKKKKKSKKKSSANEEITPEESDVFFDDVIQHTSEEIIFNADEDTTEEEIPADVAAQEEAPTDFNSIRAALEEKSAEVPPPKPDGTDDLM